MRRIVILAALILSSTFGAPAQAQNTINTVAGGGTNGATAATVYLPAPYGIAKDKLGNTYLSVPFLYTVYKVTAAGAVSVYAGTGTLGFSGDNGPATSAQLGQPQGLAVDGNGNLFIAESQTNRIRKVDTSGTITTVAGSGNQYNGVGFFGGYSGDGGPATSALLNGPNGVAVDSNENLFIADTNNNVIRMVDNSPEHIITTIAGGAAAVCAGATDNVGDGCPATQAVLAAPEGVAIHSSGDLYIADTGFFLVRKVDNTANHIITTYAGNGGGCPAQTDAVGDGCPAPVATLSFPDGIFVDGTENVFVGDNGNQRVRRIDHATQIITSAAGNGSLCLNPATPPPSCGDGGPATSALLNSPIGVIVDGVGNIIFADSGTDRYRMVTPGASPTISNLAGGGNGGDTLTATNGLLANPLYVVSDAAGNFFTSESFGFRVRRVDAGTQAITTYAGNGIQGTAGNGGQATQANLLAPTSMALDPAGNLYFRDGLVVRKVDVGTKAISVVAGTGARCNVNANPTCGNGGPATSAPMARPSTIALDPQGNLYIADVRLSQIRVVCQSAACPVPNPIIGDIFNFAGTGVAGFTNGPALSATMNFPFGMVFDGNGNMYFADSNNNVIRKIDNTAAHNVTTYAFNGQPTFGGDGGNALSASMQFPQAVALDPSNNLFVGGGLDNIVRRIDANDHSVITVAGNINNLDGGFAGDGGPATKALLDNFGVAVAPGQNLLIADVGNNRIRKVPLAPVATVTSMIPASFGPVLQGGLSNPGLVTIMNGGLDDLTVTNVAAPAPFLPTNSCPVSPATGMPTVAPGGTCILSVSLNPASNAGPGPVTGNLTFNTSDPSNKSFTFALAGTVIAAPGVALTVSIGGPGTGTITGAPAGVVGGNLTPIACPPTCTSNYAAGEQVNLIAVPNPGFTLTSWTANGNPTCPGAPIICTVTMSAAQNVTANFGPATVTVSAMGNGSGTITINPGGVICTVTNGVIAPNPCTATGFPAGTNTVTLTATAAAGGSKFAGWLGICGLTAGNPNINTSGTGPCDLPLTIAGVTALNGALVTAVFSGPAKTFGQGDVFVGTVDGMIFEYTAAGALVQVLTSGNLGGTIAQMNFDTAGNLYAANPSAINTGPNPGTVEVFSNNGQGGTFDFGMFNSSPTGVLVAPSGNVFVGQSAGQNTLLQFTNVANGSQPISTFFPAYDNGGIGYIELLDNGASVLYSTQTAGSAQTGTVKNFDILNNHQNPDFATGLTGGPAFAIRELADKSVLVANTTQIVHLDQTGKPMGAPSPYKPGGGGLFYSLNLDPSGTSFWTGDAFSGKVYQVRITDGTILNTINTGLGFNSQALSFNTIFGIAVFGQPQSGGADVTVSMTAPNAVAVSTAFNYSITVVNSGPLASQGVTLSDVFPAGVTVNSAISTQGPCVVGQTVTCTIGNINANAPAVTVTINVTPTQVMTLNDTVTVNGTTPDPIPGNNSFTTSTSVVTPSLATISLFAPGFVELGTSLTYTMVVMNPGAVSIAGITAQLSVPPVLGAPSSVSQGCSAITLICTIGTLTPGQIVTLDLTFVPSGLTNLNSNATVTGGGVANATTVVINNGVPLVLEVDSVNPADFITTSPSGGICTTAQGICTIYFSPGTPVTVTANGPGFVGWSVNNASSASCPPASNTCGVTLNSPQQVVAGYSAIGFVTPQLTGVVEIPFGVDFSHGVIGGVSPYTITLTGTVPSGLTFTTPSLAGIPTATGVTQLTVNITDAIGDKASTPVTLTIISAPSGQEALMNGNYAIVFHLVNDSDGSLFAVAGSLHFKGNGVIDSGTLDTNGTGAGRAPQTLSVTGTYTIGADHRCLITLQNVGKSFAVIACSVGDVYQGVAHTAHIIEFDDNTAGGLRGAGIAKLQDSNAFNANSFAGPYIFAGTGQNSTFGRLIEEGLFTVTNTGNFGSGSADVNDNGTLASVPSITGTYSEPGLAVPIDPGTGRTQWSLNNATTSAASFIIDANNVVFVTKDPVAASGLVIAGTAERQLNTAPFDATFLSGPVVIAAQGPSNAGKNSNVLVGVGTFTAAAGPNPATGTLSLTKDTNDSGNVTLEGIENDTYTMAANGRLVVTPGSGKQVFGYLSRPNRGYVMGTDASVDFGTIDLQTGGPFTVPTLATDYFFGDREPSSTTRGEVVSGVVSLSNNTASATFDQSHAGGRLDYDFSASFGVSVTPAGRLILTHNPASLISTSDQIGQVITPSHLIFTEFDPSQNRPTLHEEQSFLMPAGVPVATPSPVAFGIVQIGQQANLNVTITNNSDGLLSLTGLTNATDFSVTGPCLTTFPSVVLAHNSCIGTVTFKPQPGTQTGVLLNEILTIATDAGNLQINATGTAAAGAATHFLVTAPAAATAGTAFNVTVTAQDATNNTATSYTGTVHFTSTDGAAKLPADTTLTNGTGTFPTTLNTAGSQTITATDTATASITGSTNVTVTAMAPTLVSIAVTPLSPVIGAGQKQQFTATGTFSDNSMQNLTTTATWASSLPGVATVSNAAGSQGSASAVANGTTLINATLSGVTGTAALTVAPPVGFVFTGNLNTNRSLPTATLLNDGTVLFAGGLGATGFATLASAEVYTPANGAFTTTGNMTTARRQPSATVLTNGMVLFAGGADSSQKPLATAEIYNPGTGTFAATGSMGTSRFVQSATLLPDGTVLMAGGFTIIPPSAAFTPLATAELFNPATGNFTPTGNMTFAGAGTATLLNNGKVLIVAANAGVLSANLYDPATKTFTATAGASNVPSGATATLLNNGMVLFTGGLAGGNATANAELYNPATDTFTVTGSMITGRFNHTATLLNNGMVLVVAGYVGNNASIFIAIPSAELYDPAAGSFTETGTLNTARDDHTATLLNNGKVLVAGGDNADQSFNVSSGDALASAELYTPATMTPPGLTSITVTPANPTIPVGPFQRFVATGTFNAGPAQTLASVTWSSSNVNVATITNDAGSKGFADDSPGTTTITAAAGNVNGSTLLTVVGPATHFAVSAQGLVSAGTAFNFTVTAQDAANNTVTTFADTVNFSSSDAAAILPPSDVSLTNGVGNFQATLNTVGPQTITVTDANSAAIKGVSNSITVSAGAPQTVNVHLLDNGTGAVGTVVDNSVPQQINCTDATGQLPGPACSTTYPDGTTVTFTATPGAGAAFVNWNGSNVICQAGTPANVCTFAVTGLTSLEANFTNGPGGPFTLTVAPPAGASGGGRVSSGVTGGALNCTFTAATTSGACTTIPLKSGTVTEAIPQADPNSTFGGYAGTCPTQVGNNCFVPMSQNQTVTPVFTIIPVTVNVTVTGNGSVVDNANPAKIHCSNTNGVITGPCSANYNSGTSVTLTEFTGAGYSLTSFGNCGVAMTCTLNLTAANNPVAINATFTINTYLLAVSTAAGTGGGTVTSNVVNGQGGSINCGPGLPVSGCQVFATFGTQVVLTENPQGTATFTGWSSPGVAGFVLACPTAPTCTFNMPVTPAGGLAVNATFTAATQQFPLTVTDAGTGTGTVKSQPGLVPAISCTTGTPDGCTGSYNSGTVVTLTATAGANSAFAGWSGGTPACSGAGTCSVTMSQAQDVTATFNTAAALQSITIIPATPSIPQGQVLQLFAQGNFSDGTVQDLTAASTWSSDTPGVATVSNAAGSQGQVTGVAGGTATISAKFGGITGSTLVTVASLPTMVPPDLFFTEATIGTQTAAQPTTFTNPGPGALQVSGVTITGSFPADFGQTSDCGTVSGPGGCPINATFKPSTLGPETADVSVASNSPFSPTVAHLVGNGTVRQLPGFLTNVLPANDDNSTGAVPLPFPINYFGTTYNSLFVNNNGNVTFGQAFGNFTPTGLNGNNGGIPIMAPFWADVDTTGLGSNVVTYGNDTVNGHQAFGVNYQNVGYFASNFDKLNSFQLVIVDRSDTGAGNFDMEFNYDRVQWEAGDASGGTGGLCGALVPPACVPAAVGYSNGTGNPGTNFQLAGSFVPGALLDGGPAATSLIANALNTDPVLGRYVFAVRNGAVQANTLTLTLAGTGTGTVKDNVGQLTCSDTNGGQKVCNANYPTGTQLILTATADAGSTFMGWSAPCAGMGTCAFTITQDTGITATFTPANVTLQSITVAPAAPSIVAGTMQPFTATGHFSDGSSGPVAVTWSSANAAIATIDANTGVATGVSAGGPIAIKATSTQNQNVSGTAQLTVTAPVVLVSIAVTPVNPSVVVGQNQQFTATGTFSDNSQQDITASVVWASSNTDSATITAGGLATGLSGGTNTTISASKAVGNTIIKGSTTLTVTNVPFVLTITPPPGGNPGAPPTVSPGGTLAIGLTLTASPNFNGTVTFGCNATFPNGSSASQFLTCTPAPNSVTLSGNTPKQVAIVMNTFCQGETPMYGPGPGGFGGGLALLLAAAMLGSITWAYRTRSRWALSFAVLILIALGNAACSSLPSGPNGRTPAGTYILNITATAGGASQTVQQPIQVN